MFTRDANNATWYVLRYARDFVPPPPDPAVPGWQVPVLEDAALFYDDARHVLELRPTPSLVEEEPLPGIAVDVDGEIYRVDPVTGTLVVRRCDGSECGLVCERDVLATPAGLALDRRGYLYVADRLARRVVVVLPDDGSVAGVLVGGLVEPVDVAVAPTGRIYVADRAGGLIVMFNARLERVGAFSPRNGEAQPASPRPIAVMIDADGSVLVADAAHPRLLRFDPDGHPRADVELQARLAELPGGPVALDALTKAYGRSVPRFLAGVCGPPRPTRDGAERLAAVHLALRLLMLRLTRSFAACGTYVSAALDGGSPGVQWHRVEIDADLPPGTWLKVQTVTADDPEVLSDPSTIPTVHPDPPAPEPALVFTPDEDASCDVKPAAPAGIPDRLVLSPPGRYLRLRLALGSDGRATPTVRAVRVFYPRVSYLDLLPRVYRRDAEGQRFLEHFLALFEHILTDVEDRYELFSRQLNPDAAPLDVIDWLACLIDLAFDPSWSLDRRRALVAAAMELYRMRGTPKGIERFVEIYTGVRPTVIEGFLTRPEQPPFLGRPGSVLGCATSLAPTSPRWPPEVVLVARHAHRFTVLVYLEDDCDEAVMLSVVDRIVETNKPAHTVHRLRAMRPESRVGWTQVGLDLRLGARTPPRTPIGGCPEPGAPPGPPAVLGLDSVLGSRRPQYLRPMVPQL